MAHSLLPGEIAPYDQRANVRFVIRSRFRTCPRVSVAHEQEIRARISVAALKVFGELGFHRATVQDIVRESGLSVGAIYTYFSGKDELFLATCDLTTGQGIGELADRLTQAASVAERLAIGLGFFFDSVEFGRRPGRHVDVPRPGLGGRRP